MAQKKILLDTCVYLRLGKLIHPLLQWEFGAENYCLYVIPQLDEEYRHQPRLLEKHPWVNEGQYRLNRGGEIILSRKQKTLRSQLLLTLDASAWEHDLDLSRTDIEALPYKPASFLHERKQFFDAIKAVSSDGSSVRDQVQCTWVVP